MVEIFYANHLSNMQEKDDMGREPLEAFLFRKM